MIVRKAGKDDLRDVVRLSLLLWPSHEPEEMEQEFAELMNCESAALFLAIDDDAVGFAQCQLRRDYVEGTESSPVGYLEGIFVQEEARSRGCARSLLTACEAWAREKGCSEFASDCELENTASLAFHKSLGFEEANRIICFTKKL